jgi:hypothetical protein
VPIVLGGAVALAAVVWLVVDHERGASSHHLQIIRAQTLATGRSDADPSSAA